MDIKDNAVARSAISSVRSDVTAELENLYKKSYVLLVGFAVLFILPREVAEEIVQEVFVETLARAQRDKIFNIENPEAYVKSAIALKAKGKHRRNFLRVVKEEKYKNQYEAQFSPIQSDNDYLNEIADAIEQLPYSQKQCIILKYYEGLKISEIADLLHLSQGTVKTHLFRATSTLKTNILDKTGKDSQ